MSPNEEIPWAFYGKLRDWLIGFAERNGSDKETARSFIDRVEGLREDYPDFDPHMFLIYFVPTPTSSEDNFRKKQDALLGFLESFFRLKQKLAEAFPDHGDPVSVTIHPDLRYYLSGAYSGSPPKPERKQGRRKDPSRSLMIVRPTQYLVGVGVHISTAQELVRDALWAIFHRDYKIDEDEGWSSIDVLYRRHKPQPKNRKPQ